MPTKYNCSRNLSKHFAIYKKALRPRDGWGGSGARCARGFLFDGMAKVLGRGAPVESVFIEQLPQHGQPHCPVSLTAPLPFPTC